MSRWWYCLTAIVAAGVSAAVIAHGNAGATGVARVAQAAPATAAPATTIPAKLTCASLVQNGTPATSTVPDFELIPGAPTRITAASVVAATASQPEYCDVLGYIQSQIKFELKLPTTTWQGRYLEMGCGGFCGSITPTTFPACRTQLGGDFAIASTNDGHDASGTDALWAGQDPQQRIDFGYRSVHVLAIAAKAIQAAYYGQAPTHDYFVGCSDGGREGLDEAQKYPDDFDGIVAGAPANGMSTDPMYLAWGVDANSDASGQPILTASKLPALHAAVVKACDGNDGVVGDGQIGDPRVCAFDPGSIQCPGATDAAGCLTPAQVKVVRTLYAGIFDRHGTRLDLRNAPKGSELNWVGWWVPAQGAPTGIRSTVAWSFGQSAARWLSYPIGAGRPLEAVQLTARDFYEEVRSARYYEAMDPDLSAFRRHGGRLIMYQGMSDPLVPMVQTLEYYNALRAEAGGQREADRFARLFMIAGMGHCGGGPTPDTSDLTMQIVNWVEQGRAPDSISVTDTNSATDESRTRPVFSYPNVAKYVGPNPASDPTGPDKPQNFVEAPPTVRHDDNTVWLGDFLLGQRH
jgi:feruloyl esterase